MKLSDVIDIAKLQALVDRFNKVTGAANGILGLDGSMIVASGWLDICTKFHRGHPLTSARCTESDSTLVGQLLEGQPFALYTCKNGLTDVAAPIVIGGEHLANLFTGQFLLAPPDEDFFRKQAREFGFDEEAYIKALAEVPVIPEEKARAIMGFLAGLAEVMGEMGLARIKQQQHTSEIAMFRALADNAPDAFFIVSLEGHIRYANRAAYDILGYDAQAQELIGQSMLDMNSDEQIRAETMQVALAVSENGAWQGELRQQRKDGTVLDIYDTLFIIYDENSQPTATVSIVRDISGQKEAEAERERLQQQIIDAQQLALKELSTPVIPIYKRADVGSILVMPLIGTVDTKRAKDITRRLLAGISEHEASIVILDITGVPIVDTGVADHLNKTVQAARLKGAHTIVTGVSDAVAETIVELGVEWEGVQILRNLQTGLIAALNWMGVKLDNK